jgi:hypothetical protein
VYNDSLVDELVGDGDYRVKMVVNGLSQEWLFFNHGESLSDTVNHRFHDEVIFLLIADQVYLKFVDDLEQY